MDYRLYAFELDLSDKFTFDNFVEGKSNEEAYRAALQVAKGPASWLNPLFIYGSHGLGKTHLLQAIGNYMIQHNIEKRVVYLTAERLKDYYPKLVAESRNGNSQAILEFKTFLVENCRVLLLDDIDILDEESYSGTRKFISDVIKQFLVKHTEKQLVITSNKEPEKFENFEQPIISRLCSGLKVKINPPDYKTRFAIVIQKANEIGLEIPQEVAELIATRVTGDVRRIEGAVKMLNFVAQGTGKITLKDAERILLNVVPSNTLTPDKIIQVVAEEFGISPSSIKSQSREKGVSIARHVAMFLIREMFNYSTTQIGQIFGGRDHSTVIYGIEKVRKEKEEKTWLKERIEKIKMKLTDSN